MHTNFHIVTTVQNPTLLMVKQSKRNEGIRRSLGAVNMFEAAAVKTTVAALLLAIEPLKESARSVVAACEELAPRRRRCARR